MKRGIVLFRVLAILLLIISAICSIKLLWDVGVALDESFSFRQYFDRNEPYMLASAIGFPVSAFLNVACSWMNKR